MLDCSKVARLTAATPERPLDWRERFGIAVHLLLCPPCRAYRRQLDALRRATAGLAGRVDEGEPGLEADARERIRARLRDAADD